MITSFRKPKGIAFSDSGSGGSGAGEGSNDAKPAKSAKSSTLFCDLQTVVSDLDSESISLTAGSNITVNELHAELKRQKTSISKLHNN